MKIHPPSVPDPVLYKSCAPHKVYANLQSALYSSQERTWGLCLAVAAATTGGLARVARVLRRRARVFAAQWFDLIYIEFLLRCLLSVLEEQRLHNKDEGCPYSQSHALLKKKRRNYVVYAETWQ